MNPTSLLAAVCSKPTPTFLGLKPWWYYLGAEEAVNGAPDQGCIAKITNINELWRIGVVVFEDMLVIAAYVAIIFVIWGGFKLMTSQGDPEGIKNGRQIVINSLIGLVIAIIASQVVGFIARGVF